MHKSHYGENQNSYKLKLALVIVLILVQGLVFFDTWVNYYNELLRFPYIMKGNIFLMLVYMGLTYIFMTLFDCNNLSEYRPAYLIFSESLSIISCNIIVYLVIIIPAAALGLMPMMPIVIMTLKDIIIIILWSFLLYNLFKILVPPKDILLITSKNNMDEMIYKISKRNDLYKIKEQIIFNNNLSEIYDKCNNYNNILIGDVTSEVRNDIIKHCFNNFRSIYVIPKLSDILLKYSDDLFIFDTPLFLSTSFGIPIEIKFFKRLIDFFLSVSTLFIFMPIWIIVAILIKIEDGGPIFYCQERVTINNKLFNIIKFRSMKVTNSNEVLPTLDSDDRITRIGSFIRKYHIDEIPQLINVIKGDMSIVGPRPERKEHVDLYSREIREFHYRNKVKAGLTGLAQIYGKYNTSAIDKLKLDLIYIKRCSILFDLELIVRTIKVLFIKENTEGFSIESQEYIKVNAKQ